MTRFVTQPINQPANKILTTCSRLETDF